MTNIEKLNRIFEDVFPNAAIELGNDFNNKNVEGWDSVRQLSLTSNVEDSFDIMLDAEDIISFNSYEGAKQILKKYDIEL